MKVLGIAIRNVQRQRRRAVFLGGAVALSFLSMTFMEGLTGGMSRSLRRNIESGHLGELYLIGKEWREDGPPVARLADPETALQAIKVSGLPVTTVIRKSGAEAQIIYGGRSARISLAGIPWEGPESMIGTPGLSSGSLEAMADPRGVVIPDALAKRLDLVAGEAVLVKTETVTGQANVTEFIIAAVLASGDDGLFQSAFAHLGSVNALLGLPKDGARQLNIFLEGEPELESAASRLLEALRTSGQIVRPRETETKTVSGLPGGPGGPLGAMFGDGDSGDPWEGTRYEVGTLEDHASQFLSILGTIRVVSVLIFLVLLAITATGIVNTFRMIVIERTREIGTIRAMGMRARDVQWLFILESLIVSSTGSLAGLALAILVMALAAIPHIGGAEFSMFLDSGRLSFAVSPAAIFGYLLLVAFISAAAARGPAKSAARLKPVEALKS